MKIIFRIAVIVLGLFLLGMFTAVGDAILFPLLDKLGFAIGRKFGLKTTVEKTDNPLQKLVGRTATCLTDMLPSGKIEIDGNRYDATAIKGSIKKGRKVIVRKTQGNTLYVNIIEMNKTINAYFL